MKPDLCLIQLTKINSTWIKYLNVRPEIINHVEENLGSMLFGISIGNDFYDKAQKVQAILQNKTKHRWDYIKLRSLCTAKEAINKLKGNL